MAKRTQNERSEEVDTARYQKMLGCVAEVSTYYCTSKSSMKKYTVASDDLVKTLAQAMEMPASAAVSSEVVETAVARRLSSLQISPQRLVPLSSTGRSGTRYLYLSLDFLPREPRRCPCSWAGPRAHR
jgi:hypothetical protein